MQQLLLCNKEQQDELENLFNEINEGVWQDDETIIELLDESIKNLSIEDKSIVLKFINIQYRGRGFIKEKYFLQNDSLEEQLQIDHKKDYEIMLKNKLYQQILQKMKTKDFCSENQLPELICKHIGVLEKLLTNQIAFIFCLIENQKQQFYSLPLISLLKGLLSLIYEEPMQNINDQLILEQIVGSILLQPIFEFQLFFSYLKKLDEEQYNKFEIVLQQTQMQFQIKEMKYTHEILNPNLQFLIQLFSSDIKKNKQILDEYFIVFSSKISDQNLTYERILRSLDLLSQNIQQSYFIVVWYFWGQYALLFNIDAELAKLDQQVNVQKIDLKKRPILYKQTINLLKKINNSILTYFVCRTIYFLPNEKDCIQQLTQYENYRENQEKLLAEYQNLQFATIQEIIKLEQIQFKRLWELVQSIQYQFLIDDKVQSQCKKIIQFLMINEFDPQISEKITKVFQYKTNSSLLFIQIIQFYFPQKSKFFILQILEIATDLKKFDIQKQRLLINLYENYRTVIDGEIFFEFQKILSAKKYTIDIVEYIQKLKIKQLKKFQTIFDQNDLHTLTLGVLELYLDNLGSKITTIFENAFTKLFFIIIPKNNSKLECFKILFKNIKFGFLTRILQINQQKDIKQKSVILTISAIFCLINKKKYIQDDFFDGLQQLITHQFYNFPLFCSQLKESNNKIIITKIILINYHDSFNLKAKVNILCEQLFSLDENVYQACFQNQDYFGNYKLTPEFLKRKILYQQYPNNIDIDLESFNISLAELSIDEQEQIIINWLGAINDVEKFKKLIPFFFNIIKRGESAQQILSLIRKMKCKESKINLNMKALFQILYNNSNNELKVMLLKFWSKFNPVPLIFQNQNLELVQNQEQLYSFNYYLFYIIFESLGILNFTLSKNQVQIGKTTLINEVFYQMEKFETSDNCQINKNTIDILFDYSFNGSRRFAVCDVHGQISYNILFKLLPLFKLWIIQMDSENEIEENYNQIKKLEETIITCKPQICFIIRNSRTKLQNQYQSLIEQIKLNFKISFHFIPDLTEKGLSKEDLQAELENASKFLYTEIQLIQNKNYLLNQDSFLGVLKQFKDDHYRKSVAIIESHQQLIKDFAAQLENLILKKEGFLSYDAFPLRSIEQQIKIKRELQITERLKQNSQIEIQNNLKNEIEQLEKQMQQQNKSKLIDLFCSLFEKENYYVLYLWFTDIIRKFNEEKTSQLQMKTQELNEEIQKIKKNKEACKTNNTNNNNKQNLMSDSQLQSNKDRIEQIKKELEENQKNISYRNIGIELFWRELIQQKQSCPESLQRINPEDYIYEMIKKGEPFEFLDGDQLKINNQFLKQLSKKFQLNGKERLLILSVLGPQSSGKSTILNKIFGCHFWTSVGRCTKGIYLQLLKIHNKQYFNNLFDYILLLDTEGLQNPNQQDPEFDKKIALFVLAVSDIILINVKGDIHAQFRNLVEMCIYTLGQMKSNFSLVKQLCWCFNQNNDVKNFGPFLDQIQGIASNLNKEFSKEQTIVDYNEILDIKQQNIKILGFSNYEKSWKSNNTLGKFQEADWRQQIQFETFSQEAYQYGIQIINTFIEKFLSQKEQLGMSDLNCFIQDIDGNWNSIQRLPDLLEFSELLSHQQNQYMKTKSEEIISGLDFSFLKRVQKEIQQRINQYKKLSLDIFCEIQQKKEVEILSALNSLKKSAQEKIQQVKVQQKISKKITSKYLRQLENRINNEFSECKIIIYEEIKNYERQYQEKQGFAYIDSFVSDLSQKPDQLKEYQEQPTLISNKFNNLWADIITKLHSQQQILFDEFQLHQYQSITQAFTQYTLKSSHDQEYYFFLKDKMNKQNPNDNHDEQLAFFQIFKQELQQIQFMAIDNRNQKNVRYLDIFHLPITSRLQESSPDELISMSEHYYYNISWKVIGINQFKSYFSESFFADLQPLLPICRDKKNFIHITNFLFIFQKFGIKYNKENFDQLNAIIKNPKLWQITQGLKDSGVKEALLTLTQTLEFTLQEGKIFFEKEDSYYEFIKTYPSLKIGTIENKYLLESQWIQERQSLSQQYFILQEKKVVKARDETNLHFHYIAYPMQPQLQQYFQSNFPLCFNQIMQQSKGWEKLYTEIYNIIKCEMIGEQKLMKQKNPSQQDQSDPENSNDDDHVTYSNYIIKIILDQIQKKIDCLNNQFSKYGVILRDLGERCIYYFSILIIWRFSCSKKWRLLEKNTQKLQNNQKQQLEKFIADIKKNKVEQSRIKAQTLVNDIWENFIDRFYQDQSPFAIQSLEKKETSSFELIEKLDKEHLNEYLKKKQNRVDQIIEESETLMYIMQQQKYIHNYVNKKIIEFSQEIENNFELKLKNQVKAFLEKIQYNADLLKLQLKEGTVKTRDYFIQENEQKQDEYYEQKLYQIVFRCLQGDTDNPDLDQIEEQYKSYFSGYVKIEQKILTKMQNNSEQEIQLLKSYIDEISLKLGEKLKSIEKIKINLAKLYIQSKLDQIRLQMNGCQETCPMCNRKCDLDNDEHDRHMCKNGHQLRGMNGVLIENQPSLFTCEEIEDDSMIRKMDNNNEERSWREIKQIYPEWSFRSLNTDQIETNKNKMMIVWNEGIGKLICNYLTKQLNTQVHFEIKHNLQSTYKNSESVHYIFMLDDSGSMQGTKWNNIKDGAQSCMEDIKENPNAKVSVIIFNHQARLVINCDKVDPNKHALIYFQDGGTDFESAFQLACTQVSHNQKMFTKIILLFYTDGEGDYPEESVNQIQNLDQQLRKKITFIACTEEEDARILEEIVNKLKKSLFSAEFKKSIQTTAVKQIWKEIVSQAYHKLRY